MLIKTKQELSENDATAESIYFQRRQFVKIAIASGLAYSLPSYSAKTIDQCDAFSLSPIPDNITAIEKVTSYNNYYEFSTSKKAIKILAQELSLSPWSLSITGEVEKPIQIDLEKLLSNSLITERIYRFRCVEG